MNATGWSRGLDVRAAAQGVMLHAGLVLVRELADRTGLRAGLSARDYLPGLAWFGARVMIHCASGCPYAYSSAP